MRNPEGACKTEVTSRDRRWVVRCFVPAIFLAFFPFFPSLLRADTVTYTVGTCIDGEDYLILSPAGLQWEYLNFNPVGVFRDDCTPSPDVAISSTLNGVPVVTNETYDPIFPGDPTPVSGALSQVIALSPSFPSDIIFASLTVLQARESLTMLQAPTNANGDTMILDFDDNDVAGAAFYAADITIDTPDVPEPSSLFLLGGGLIGLAGVSFARKRLV